MFFMNLYPCNPCHPWSSPCGLLWALRVSAVHPRGVPGFGGWPAAGTFLTDFRPGSLTKPLQIQHFRKTVYRPTEQRTRGQRGQRSDGRGHEVSESEQWWLAVPLPPPRCDLKCHTVTTA